MRGRLVLNGNMGSPTTLLERVQPLVLGAAGGRPPQVLLVTAAWGAGEYGEGGVRSALNAAGVSSDWQGGHDRQIQNLCAWHTQQEFLTARPQVAAVAAELAAVQEETRRFYVDKTAFHAQRVREAVAFARRRVGPGFRLGRLPLQARDGVQSVAALTGRQLLGRALARELAHDLADLVQNDRRMMQALAEAEATLPARTGLRLDPLWQRLQATLQARVLQADVLVLPGGDPDALLGALRFFDLKPALWETLRRGATFVAVSAGTLVLCEHVVIYDNFSPDLARREFRLYDRGLGLVSGLQILPHCMDRIHTDDPDNLAYLARRFSSTHCVGLNEESFLLVEPGLPRATAVGRHDGVYVFGADGVKHRYHFGEHIALA